MRTNVRVRPFRGSYLISSHSYDSKFTEVQSHSFRPPRRRQPISLTGSLPLPLLIIHNTLRSRAAQFSQHNTETTNSFPSRRNRSRIHLLLSPRWREPAHTLAFRRPSTHSAVQPPLHGRSLCPVSYLGRIISVGVSRKHTSIAPTPRDRDSDSITAIYHNIERSDLRAGVLREYRHRSIHGRCARNGEFSTCHDEGRLISSGISSRCVIPLRVGR